jgi:hypothetical protein
MGKHVLFYSPLAIWYPHFETELELIENHLQAGDTVTVLRCRGELPACAPNPNHQSPQCRECKGRFASGMRWLGRDRVHVEDFLLLTDAQREQVERIKQTRVSSRDELRGITLEGSDIGQAALGSVISALREPEPDIQKHWPLIAEHLATAALVHFSIKNHLEQKKPDLFVLFNGRFAELRPALRVARMMQIETHVHETAGGTGRYSLSINNWPHALAEIKRQVEDVYARSPLSADEKKGVAWAWFEQRRNARFSDAQLIYTGQQVNGLLPESLTSQTRNIVMFNSSEDEFATLEEWWNPFYRNQDEGITRILEALQAVSPLRFFVRVHPNLKGVENSQSQRLHELAALFPSVEFIPADSAVSTYALIDACDAVLTFGSTVGAEALYRGKPSILMGRAPYEDLGGVIRPESHEALLALLKEFATGGALPTAGDAELAATKFGFYQSSFGVPFRWVKHHEWYRAAMCRDGKETIIRPGVMHRILSRFSL